MEILPSFEDVMGSKTNLPSPRGQPVNGANGLLRILDRNFRLLYCDAVVPICQKIKNTVEELLKTEDARLLQIQQSAPATFLYHSARIECLEAEIKHGVKFRMSIDQPRHLDSKLERDHWWSESKLLLRGSYICLIDLSGHLLHCFVEGEKDATDPGLYEDLTTARVTLRLVETDTESIHQLAKMYNRNGGPYVALEFPTTLVASFKYTLASLQEMSKNPKTAFFEILTSHNVKETRSVPPPDYTKTPSFQYRLGCLTSDGSDLNVSRNDPSGAKDIQARTSLDEAQSTALANALERKIALIQGPPGTGKSYVGVSLIRALLASKCHPELNPHGVDSGPIVVVCYTNHALDQMLEHLVVSGIKKVVRVGSRSKSDMLRDCNLYRLAKKAAARLPQGIAIGKMVRRIRACMLPEIEAATNYLKNGSQPEALKSWLQQYGSQQYQELFPEDPKLTDETRATSTSQKMNEWLREGDLYGPPRQIAQLLQCSVFELNRSERRVLFSHWMNSMFTDLAADLLDSIRALEKARQAVDDASQSLDLTIFESADVVGLTTTGFARNRSVLQKLKPKILVCEEAGEVLEAHLITTFLPSLEHVVLIGDHQQLRPRVNRYDLTTEGSGGKFSLDKSLFERLISESKLPYDTLSTQRRMHPEISRLIKGTLYPRLNDSPTVSLYPPVTGMYERLFWLDHHSLESNCSGEAEPPSYENDFEARMTVALVAHLVKQGVYGPGEIAVLTPYSAQLRLLQSQLTARTADIFIDMRQAGALDDGLDGWSNPECEEDADGTPRFGNMRGSLIRAVRLSTVDNFQGEEAKVVIISLVRSNEEKKPGFLKTHNRINVLLSRAQHGMYIIGNSKTATAYVKMWKNVVGVLRTSNQLGSALKLRCPYHLDEIQEVRNPEDFEKLAPNGGCLLRCGRKLACGHKCLKTCHGSVSHNKAQCLYPHCRSKRPLDKQGASQQSPKKTPSMPAASEHEGLKSPPRPSCKSSSAGAEDL
jgi:hypothetical protein